MAKVKAAPIVANRLRSFIERIERLDEERKAILSDIKDVFSEAKGVGYDIQTMRKVLRLRAMDPADRAEQETLLETYLHALGMIDRVDARISAGESQREIAKAEGISKTTVQRRGPKLAVSATPVENGPPDAVTPPEVAALPLGTPQPPSTREATPRGAGAPSEPTEPAAQAVNAGLPPGGVSPGRDNGQGSEAGTITESCGAACEQQSGADDSEKSPLRSLSTQPDVATGPQDTEPHDLVREVDPEAMAEAILAEGDAPPPDDDLEIPAFLDRRQKRRPDDDEAAHPS